MLAAAFLSCNNNDDETGSAAVSLIGNWKLRQIRIDSGDGSGNFQSVSSNKTVTFNADGTVHAFGSLCAVTVNAFSPAEGTYDETDSTIIAMDCPELPSHYAIEDNKLIISYPFCDGICQEKFVKVE